MTSTHSVSTLGLLITLLATASIAGCSSGSGTPKDGLSPPNSGEEAIKRLSPQNRASFDAWKSQLVKSCDASEAFGLRNGDGSRQVGLDSGVLVQKNGNSVVFVEDGSFAAVTEFHSFPGESTTRAEETQQLNGQSTTVTAETKRLGTHCSVLLFGQKVFETEIAQSVASGFQFIGGQEFRATSNFPLIQEVGNQGKSEASQTGVFALLYQVLKPTQAGVALLGRKLGLTSEQTAEMITFTSSPSVNASIRLSDDSTAIWSDAGSEVLVAGSGVLKNLLSGSGDQSLQIEVRLPLPTFTAVSGSVSGSMIKNDRDEGSVKITQKISVSKKEAGLNYVLNSAKNEGTIAFDLGESVQCSKDRAGAYVGAVRGIRINSIQPSVQEVFGPCRTLYREIEKVSYENGLMKSLISQVFKGVTPSGQFQYSGWDQVLSTLALTALEQGRDIRSTLDPQGTTSIVGTVG